MSRMDCIRSVRRFLPRRRWTRAVAVSALLAVAAGGVYGARALTGRDDAARNYTVAAVQRGDLEDTVTSTGILQPRDYVDVGTQVSGQLKALHVEIGSPVKAGQLIAEIDPTVYRSRVDADEAQLRTQQAQLQDKQAQLALAEQQHERQSYTKIYAPMSGTVVAQSAKQGQTLNANQQAPVVVRIADLSTMTVQSQVSEADVSSLRPGMRVYFTTLGDASKRWYGTLRQINPTPETVNSVVLYDALFDVKNPDGALMTQMTAQVFFVTAEARDAVLGPAGALRPAGSGSRDRGSAARDGGGAAAPRAQARTGDAGASVDVRARFANRPAVVRVTKAGGEIEARDVRVGVVSRVSAQILSGLEPGEQIVVGQRTTAPAPAARPSTGSTRPMMPPRV